MPTTTDIEALPVQAARRGDAEAWDALFRRYQLPLYTYVVELVQNEHTALDIVQETFVSAARYIGSLRNDARFGSWLFGIAHQKCVQHWRRRPWLTETIEDHAPRLEDPGDPPDVLLIRQEDERGFMKALTHLAPPHRAVLVLHFLEEFSLAEIAEITRSRVGTVKSRLHYAKRALRKLLIPRP